MQYEILICKSFEIRNLKPRIKMKYLIPIYPISKKALQNKNYISTSATVPIRSYYRKKIYIQCNNPSEISNPKSKIQNKTPKIDAPIQSETRSRISDRESTESTTVSQDTTVAEVSINICRVWWPPKHLWWTQSTGQNNMARHKILLKWTSVSHLVPNRSAYTKNKMDVSLFN